MNISFIVIFLTVDQELKCCFFYLISEQFSVHLVLNTIYPQSDRYTNYRHIWIITCTNKHYDEVTCIANKHAVINRCNGMRSYTKWIRKKHQRHITIIIDSNDVIWCENTCTICGGWFWFFFALYTEGTCYSVTQPVYITNRGYIFVGEFWSHEWFLRIL